MQKLKTRDIELAHTIIQPVRLKILKSLIKKPSYIAEIAKQLDVPRDTVSYHLYMMERHGLPLTSKYEILTKPHSTGTAARVYTLDTRKFEEQLTRVERVLSALK